MTDKAKQKSISQWGPCDAIRPDGVQVKALTKEMIDELVASYGHVAGLAKRAGFEMLMIHGGSMIRHRWKKSLPLAKPMWFIWLVHYWLIHFCLVKSWEIKRKQLSVVCVASSVWRSVP